MKKTILAALVAALTVLTPKTQASPLTADQLYSTQSGGLTLFNGNATLTFPTNLSDSGALLGVSNSASVQNKTFDGTSNVALSCEATYNFSAQGGTSPIVMGGNCALPVNAILRSYFLDVITAPTDTLAANISVQLLTAADIIPATAKASWAIGDYQGIPAPSGNTSTFTAVVQGPTGTAQAYGAYKLASAPTGAPQVVVSGTGPLTAGRFNLFLNYVVSN